MIRKKAVADSNLKSGGNFTFNHNDHLSPIHNSKEKGEKILYVQHFYI